MRIKIENLKKKLKKHNRENSSECSRNLTFKKNLLLFDSNIIINNLYNM